MTVRWWPSRRRTQLPAEPDLPEPDEDDGHAAAQMRLQAQQARRRAERETPTVRKSAPAVARLPENEFVERTAKAFQPRRA